MTVWQFHLMKIPSMEWIDHDLELGNSSVLEVTSKPNVIEGTLPLHLYNELEDSNGNKVLRKYRCMIVADREGYDPVPCIVDEVLPESDGIKISAGGFSMNPNDIPWLEEEYEGVEVDPFDMFRKMWAHVQSFTNGNLGITIDQQSSPVTTGEAPEEVEFTTDEGERVEFTAGPFSLNSWTTDDLGKKIADLAEQTPFQYRERSWWVDPERKTQLRMHIDLKYPRFGNRKQSYLFELGVNVIENPDPASQPYASDLQVLGAGEGKNRVDLVLHRETDGLRRVAFHSDKALENESQARNAGKPILDRADGEYVITSLLLIDHDWAPFYGFETEDEIRFVGDLGWDEVDVWLKVVEKHHDCATGRMRVKVKQL